MADRKTMNSQKARSLSGSGPPATDLGRSRPQIKVEKRKITGRRVKQLRRDGIIPASVYGKGIKSLAVQVPLKDFTSVYKEVGETGLVDLQVNGETRPVLITNIQLHAVSDVPLHVDFHQVDLKKKVRATVPIEITGESPADKSGIGILVQQMNEIEVEALPTDLPEKLIADISKLENIDDAVLVKDLVVDRAKVEIQTDAEQIVAKVEPPAVEEVVAPPPAAEGEVPAEGAPEEGEVAPSEEAPSEGEGEKKEQS